MLQKPRLICSRTTHTIYVERVYFVLSTPTCDFYIYSTNHHRHGNDYYLREITNFQARQPVTMIPLPQTLTIYLCCSELLFMKRRSAVCSTATENQMMTLFIDELLSCTYDSSRCSSCHHITDPRRIALDGRVKAALECKHLVFAIELEWSLEIQITDLEVLFSLPMASKGTTRDLMVVRPPVFHDSDEDHVTDCCEHSSLPLVLNLLFVSAVGSVSVTSTKSNKVCRLGADVPVWMLSAIVKIHVIWLLYKPLSHESYGKASIRMPEERPWAAMMTSQYAASYQVVTIPREDELEEMFLAKNLSTHPYLLGEDQFANTTCRCLTGS
ncbi:hypothetical protein T4C_13320 [Trichinella pseudospiralis]|uniref:Uncharacterized protein n=1 Tax=Trichinella pseudospiralis TaxID=6337 RepID=A0A0V1JW07_TRIPS|nr:hypothetical protein T4C_13320 [Trichinella pseudospiralis]